MQQAIIHYTRYLIPRWTNCLAPDYSGVHSRIIPKSKKKWSLNSKIADGYAIICFDVFTGIYTGFTFLRDIETFRDTLQFRNYNEPQTKFRKKLNTKRLKFEVEIKFQKFQKEKMKLDFYKPSQ